MVLMTLTTLTSKLRKERGELVMREYDKAGNRMGEYREDSTKGNSLIKPLNYKGDVLVQVWVDSRVLATLCKWLEGEGVYTRFMSQVVKRPLEVLAEFVVENEGVERVDDTSEARNMLERRFGVNLNRGEKGKKNVLHNVILSEKRKELGEVLREEKPADVGRGMRVKKRDIKEMTARALNVYNELYKKEEIENFKRDNKELLDSLPKESVVRVKMNDEELREKMREIDVSDEEKMRAEEEANEEFLKQVRLMNERSE